MLLTKTPIGVIQIPDWQERPLVALSNEQLLEKAVEENRSFVISPATYAMIERRQLARTLQRLINPSVGTSHLTHKLLNP